MRLRIGIDGRILGFLGVHWTLVARDVAESDLDKAAWVCGYLDKLTVNVRFLTGAIFATLTPNVPPVV
jgi:hypothetical protein